MLKDLEVKGKDSRRASRQNGVGWGRVRQATPSGGGGTAPRHLGVLSSTVC